MHNNTKYNEFNHFRDFLKYCHLYSNYVTHFEHNQQKTRQDAGRREPIGVQGHLFNLHPL